jgi:hypothetical protein
VAVFLLVAEMCPIPVDRGFEVVDAQHYVIKDSSHTQCVLNAGSKRIPTKRELNHFRMRLATAYSLTKPLLIFICLTVKNIIV